MNGAGGSSRETIRPSLKDLAKYDADSLEWPPAANVSRGVAPPVLGRRDSKGKERAVTSPTEGRAKPGRQSVRINEPTEEDVRYYEPAPKSRPPTETMQSQSAGPSHFKMAQRQGMQAPSGEGGADLGRFILPLDGEGGESEEGRSQPSRLPQLPGLLSVVGGVRERPVNRKESASSSMTTSKDPVQSLPTGTSRFKAVKQAEKRASEATQSPRPTAPPPIAAASTSRITGAENYEAQSIKDFAAPQHDPEVVRPHFGEAEGEWLDEDGNVMSAFRKARLKKQGLGPPGGLRLASAPISRESNITYEDEEEEPGIAQDGQDVSSLMASISRENERKVREMKAEDVEQDLKDLESVFGKDVLESLRARKGIHKTQDQPSETSAAITDDAVEATRPPGPKKREAILGAMELVFDSNGKAMAPRSATAANADGDIYGDDEDHTCQSLLLLARSTVPGQRVFALNLLSKICSQYSAAWAYLSAPEERIKLEPHTTPDTRIVATHLVKNQFYMDVALASVFLLTDRQRIVRNAALSSLRISLLFGAIAKVSQTSPFDIRELLDAGILRGFGHLLRGDEEEQRSTRDLIISILLQLTHSDHRVSDRIVQADEGRFLDDLIRTSLKVSWPPTQEKSSERPVPACAELLLELVRSSRVNAAVLIKRDTLDALLRFAAVQPWQLDDPNQQSIGFAILTTTLRIYTDLAKYGYGASMVSRAWDLFAQIQKYALHRASMSMSLFQNETDMITAFFDILAAWTVCAEDPHQTTPEHDVTWSQVESWIEPTIDFVRMALPQKDGGAANFGTMSVLASSLGHVRAWQAAASTNGPRKLADVNATLSGLMKSSESDIVRLLQTATNALQSCANDFDAADDNEDADDISPIQRIAVVSRLLGILVKVSTTCSVSFEMDQVILSSTPLLSQDSFCSSLAEATVPQRSDILRFLADTLLRFSPTIKPSTTLKLLSSLVSGEEELAALMIRHLSHTAEKDGAVSNLSQILEPFFLECLGIRPNPRLEAERPLQFAPIDVRPTHLKRMTSLLPTSATHSSGRHSEDNEPHEDGEPGDEEIDPVTNSVLWRCPSSGLPLRPDWPLLPLDDLLRSAECATFNRKDNLPPDWDPNERAVVQATLELAVWCFSDLPTDEAATGRKGGMTATHLFFAAQKVFMLESGIQGDLRKSTGALTGKDLFRDAGIAPSLRRLLDLGSSFSTVAGRASVGQEVTFDSLATQHFGPESSYYSFYTDLVALYDSISYGDALFGLALLPPTAYTYPIDYRRLLWKDYSHVLRTIKVSEDEAPGGLAAYLTPAPILGASSSTEDDDEAKVEKKEQEEQEMVLAYLSYLTSLPPSSFHSSSSSSAPQRLLDRIAIHHVALYYFFFSSSSFPGSSAEDQSESLPGSSRRNVSIDGRRRKMARSFFESASVDQGLKEVVWRYDLLYHGQGEGEGECKSESEEMGEARRMKLLEEDSAEVRHRRERVASV